MFLLGLNNSFSGLGIAFEVVMNAYPSVDSFFTMGGCLTAYILFKELDKAGDSLPRHIILIFLSSFLSPFCHYFQWWPAGTL